MSKMTCVSVQFSSLLPQIARTDTELAAELAELAAACPRPTTDLTASVAIEMYEEAASSGLQACRVSTYVAHHWRVAGLTHQQRGLRNEKKMQNVIGENVRETRARRRTSQRNSGSRSEEEDQSRRSHFEVVVGVRKAKWRKSHNAIFFDFTPSHAASGLIDCSSSRLSRTTRNVSVSSARFGSTC